MSHTYDLPTAAEIRERLKLANAAWWFHEERRRELAKAEKKRDEPAQPKRSNDQ